MMNRDERLKQNRRNYWQNFSLGLGRGRGLFSIILLAVFSFLKRKNPNNPLKSSNKDGKGPERFETIHNPLDEN